MPTSLDLLGIAPPPGLAGASLVPLLTGDRQELGLEGYAEAMYPLHHYGWSDLRAMRAGRYKVIDAPRPELYDLQQDPKETTQPVRVSGARWATGWSTGCASSRRGLTTVTADQPADRRRPGSARPARGPRLRRDVRRQRERRRARDRADPKDKVGLFNKLSEARDATAEPRLLRPGRVTAARGGRRGPERDRRVVQAGQRVLPRRPLQGSDRVSTAGRCN